MQCFNYAKLNLKVELRQLYGNSVVGVVDITLAL